MNLPSKYLRYFFLLMAVIPLVLAVGYYTEAPWAISTWPAQTRLFTHTFLAAMLVAIAAPLIWITLAQEWGAMVAGLLNLLVILVGFTVFTFQLASADSQHYSTIFPVIFMFSGLVSVGLIFWSRRYPLRDLRPMPGLVRISFAIFAFVLVVGGGILSLRLNDRIIPWTLLPDTAVMIGWIFLGNAVYFIYAILHPYRATTIGPLLSFLAYDIVLLPRLLGHFSDPLATDQQISLLIYNAILIYSAILASYYLLLNRDIRLGRKSENGSEH